VTQPPAEPKIYHILHVNSLASVVSAGQLYCDSAMLGSSATGTTIGIGEIKNRRLANKIASHPGLHVGECVPFYFCPRSIMLYLLHCANHPDLTYRGGQEPIVHLEADLRAAVRWADENGRRWAFTLSNAGSRYFEDRCDLRQLVEIDWKAVQATTWGGPGASPNLSDGKQAEFLMEGSFPWKLVERIGVLSDEVARMASHATRGSGHRPVVEIRRDWYY
jgi:ssDNA thymidine ADP-ribosyltransferase, DarT